MQDNTQLNNHYINDSELKEIAATMFDKMLFAGCKSNEQIVIVNEIIELITVMIRSNSDEV